jgi:hypothetical protein
VPHDEQDLWRTILSIGSVISSAPVVQFVKTVIGFVRLRGALC